MTETKISSGCAAMDWLLEGGYERDVLTTIYGPPGSGKTNFLLLAIAGSKQLDSKKIVYIDTEGNFSLSRFKQVTHDHQEVLDRVVFLKPTTFEEQRKVYAVGDGRLFDGSPEGFSADETGNPKIHEDLDGLGVSFEKLLNRGSARNPLRHHSRPFVMVHLSEEEDSCPGRKMVSSNFFEEDPGLLWRHPVG